MNLSAARIVVRPRFRLELVDLAFRYVLGDAKRAFGILALVTLLPAFAVVAATHAVFRWPWWIVWIAALVIVAVIQGVFTVAAGKLLFEPTVAPASVLAAWRRRLPSYLAAMAWTRVQIVVGGTIVLPALVGWERYAFVPEAVLLEEMTARRAVMRSVALSRAGSPLGTLLALAAVTVWIVLGVETMGVSLVNDVFGLTLELDTLADDGGSYFALLGYFASVPWAASARFLAYIDGRTRQDGWDVQVRLMALEPEWSR
jgi:hypothetical protein